MVQALPLVPQSTDLDETVLELVARTADGSYVSAESLATRLGVPPEEVAAILERHARTVHRSLIPLRDGTQLYTQRTPLSGVRDAWNAFRYVNFLKY